MRRMTRGRQPPCVCLLLLLFTCPGCSTTREEARPVTFAFGPTAGHRDAHERNHLRVLSNVLSSDGGFEVVSHDDAQAARRFGEGGAIAGAAGIGAEADIVWEFDPEAIPKRLRRGQRANHFPGMAALTSKTGLADTVRRASDRGGPGGAPSILERFVPSTLAPGVSTAAEVDAAAGGGDGEWLTKRPDHGGVRVMRTGATDKAKVKARMREALAAGDVVQRRLLRPLRIDGRAFDLGVYVLVRGNAPEAVASGHDCARRWDEGSWEAKVFDEVLLRFTREAAPEGAENVTDDAALVGSKYPGAWDIPSLERLGAGGSRVKDQPTAWNALAGYLSHLTQSSDDVHREVDREVDGSGGAGERLRRDMVAIVAAALDAAAPSVASAIAAGERPVSDGGLNGDACAYPDGAGNFFELLRFDFVVEEGSLKPWLVEINASPNLKPSSPQQESVLTRLVSALAEQMSSMVLASTTSTATRNSEGATTGGFTKITLRASGTLKASTFDVAGRTGVDAASWRGPHRSLAEHADVDCVMSAWGPFSECNAKCGQTGQKLRTRTVLVFPHRLGKACGDTLEYQSCTGEACVVVSPPPSPSPSPPPSPPSLPPPSPPPMQGMAFCKVPLEFPGLGTYDATYASKVAKAITNRLGSSHGVSAVTTDNVDYVSQVIITLRETTPRSKLSATNSSPTSNVQKNATRISPTSVTPPPSPPPPVSEEQLWIAMASGLAEDASVKPASRLTIQYNSTARGANEGNTPVIGADATVTGSPTFLDATRMAATLQQQAITPYSNFGNAALDLGLVVASSSAKSPAGAVTVVLLKMEIIAIGATAQAAVNNAVSAADRAAEALRADVNSGALSQDLKALGMDVMVRNGRVQQGMNATASSAMGGYYNPPGDGSSSTGPGAKAPSKAPAGNDGSVAEKAASGAWIGCSRGGVGFALVVAIACVEIMRLR